jgi:hypothetical protein
VRVAVDAVGYDSAAEAFIGANRSAAISFDHLRSKLGGYDALGGDDTSSEDFVREYDAAAADAVDALAALVAGLGNLGEITQASAENHRRANADSVYGRSATFSNGLPGEPPVTVRPFSPPSSLGGDNTDVPYWWNLVVDHLQGWGWPSANTGQLHDAGNAWRRAAGSVAGIGAKVDVALSYLEAQRSPEIQIAQQVLGELKTSVADLATELYAIGDSCDDYGTHVDETRQTIESLLSDLVIECGVTAGIGAAVSLVTFGGAAAVGAGVIAARSVSYARLILAALRGLRAARAVAKVAVSVPRLVKAKNALDRLQKAKAVVTTFRATKKGTTIGKEGLNAKQAKNLKRFESKVPGDAENTVVSTLPDGATSFTSKVPGRVPGSYAEYTKVVDGAGDTVAYVKTTYGPDGSIIHLKDKLNP